MPTARLLTLLLPGAVPFLGAALILALDGHVLGAAAGAYPYVATAAAIFLAVRFQRGRLLTLALGLLGVVLTLRVNAATFPVHSVIAVFLPLGIAAVALMRDAPPTLHSVSAQLAALCGPALGAALISLAGPEQAATLLAATPVDSVYTSWSGLPPAALLLWTVLIATLLVMTVTRGRATDAGIAWLCVFVAISLGWHDPAGRTIWLLAAATALVLALVEASRMMAFHDELTGLPGRRALNHAMEALRGPYAVAIVDVDHFKMFNDRHGHDVGDQVLRMVATHLERVRHGTAYRSGGEEFTVLFPGLGRAEASACMEDVRTAIAAARFTLRKSDRPKGSRGAASRGDSRGGVQKLGVTISAGIAAATARSGSDAVLKAADRAMYRAKQQGRNRVVA